MAIRWFRWLAVFWLISAAVWLMRATKTSEENALTGSGDTKRKIILVEDTVPPPPPPTPAPPAIILKASDLKMNEEETTFVKKWGFNLRGLRCAVRPSTEKLVCFLEDLHGRSYCPESVTPAFLSMAPQQYSCQVSQEKSYCTARCQDGNEEVKWGAWYDENCKNPGDCPPREKQVPFDEFKTEAWTEPPAHPPKPCETRKPGPIPASFKDVSIGILTREIKSDHATITDALKSWADGGLLESVGQVMLFVNERDHSLDSLFEKYTKPPYNVKVMGDAGKNGIGRSYDWLIGNTTGKYFMFLEKDFVLVEPKACWMEQLESGVRLLEAGKADVVRQRSRFNPGRPLWALKLYVGREESVLQRQLDLLCYQYHWLEEPTKKWPKPEHFTKLQDDPPFWGSDSKFCGWTNNAHMLKTSFWIEHFRQYLPKLADGVWGLEGFMNSEQKAWHDAHHIVGLGDGMFAHVDRNNFG